MNRQEIISVPSALASTELATGVHVKILASGSLGARNLTTALADLSPLAKLDYHTHPCSEVMIVLEGRARFLVEGRSYELAPFDSLHVPADVPHAAQNCSSSQSIRIHTSFASEEPGRLAVSTNYAEVNCDATSDAVPETIVRFTDAPVYPLAERTYFRDLFSSRLGARGICGGYGLFEPGASLPCHYHDYDESISIIEGEAVCQVAGAQYTLSDYATACIPTHRPHRFLNLTTAPMAMIWVYAGDEPERTLIESKFCDGTLDFRKSDQLNH